MKSLVESLFDTEKNITKTITFGDLFELKEYRPERWPSVDLFSAPRIKKATGVTGDDKNEIIYKGLLKVIQETPITIPLEEIDRGWLKSKINVKIRDFFQHSAKHKNIYVDFYKNGHLSLGSSLDEIVNVFICFGLGGALQYNFVRK